MPIEATTPPRVPDNCPSVLPLASPTSSPPIAQRLAFSVSEAVQMLGVSDKTIRRLIDRKPIRASHALRHLRIPKTELDRFLKETSR
jgi:excisionase family DNA binding protein